MTIAKENRLSRDKDLIRRCKADIVAHLHEHGPRNWDLVCERPEYAHLIGKMAGPSGKRKFMRWRKALSAPLPPDKTRPHADREVNEAARNISVQAVEKLAKSTGLLGVSADYVMRVGAKQAEKDLNFFKEIHASWKDAVLLRTSAVEEDPDQLGTAVIIDPVAFEASIKIRLKLAQTYRKYRQEIWDIDHIQKRFELVEKVIVEELEVLPEVQRRVIERLDEIESLWDRERAAAGLEFRA